MEPDWTYKGNLIGLKVVDYSGGVNGYFLHIDLIDQYGNYYDMYGLGDVDRIVVDKEGKYKPSKKQFTNPKPFDIRGATVIYASPMYIGYNVINFKKNNTIYIAEGQKGGIIVRPLGMDIKQYKEPRMDYAEYLEMLATRKKQSSKTKTKRKLVKCSCKKK